MLIENTLFGVVDKVDDAIFLLKQKLYLPFCPLLSILPKLH